MIRFAQVWSVALRDFKKNTSIAKVSLSIILTIIFLFLVKQGINFMNFSSKEGFDVFLISGFIGLVLALTSYSFIRELVQDKKKYLKILLVTPIKDETIISGKILYYFISSAPSLFIASLFFMFWLDNASLINIILIISGFLLSVILMIGLGFFFASFFSNTKKLNNYYDLSSMYFLFFSAAFYPIDAIPSILSWVFFLNPVFYISDAIRFAITSSSILKPEISYLILSIIAILLFFFGIQRFISRMRKGN